MGQKPTKAIVAGVAGAIGVVATAQSPVAQSAVDQLTKLTTDTQHVKKVATKKPVTSTKAAQAVDNQGIVKKSDVIRAHAVSETPDLTLVADKQSSNNYEADTTAPTSQAVYQVSADAPEKVTATPAQQAVLAEADMTTEKADDTFTYTIKDGDTLGKLAIEYGTTVTALTAANPNVDVKLLQVGQQIETPKQFTNPIVTLTDEAPVTSEGTTTVAASKNEAVTAAVAPSSAAVPASSVADSALTAAGVTDTDMTTAPVESVPLTKDTTSNAVVSQSVAETTAASQSVNALAPEVSSTTATSAVAASAAENEAPVSAAPTSEANAVTTPVTEDEAPVSVAPTSEAAPISDDIAPAIDSDDSVATPAVDEMPVADDSATPDKTTDVKPAAPTSTLTSAQRSAIVSAAINFAGQDIPYVWGGKTPAGFDCSGLAAWVYQEAGVSLPSYTIAEEAYVATTDVKTKAEVMAVAQPGDLLFWGGHGTSWHVAIYIGGGQYVAAPESGMNVHIETIDEANFMPDFVGSYNV